MKRHAFLFAVAIAVCHAAFAAVLYVDEDTPGAARAAALFDLIGSVQSAVPQESSRVHTTKEGYVRVVAAPSFEGFAAGPATQGTPEQAARAFLERWGGLFVNKSPAVAFDAVRVKIETTRSFVRLRQTYAGVPVFGAEIVVQVTPAGGVACVMSDIMRDTQGLDKGKVSLDPTIDRPAAQAEAVKWLARQHEKLEFEASPAELMIYCPSVVGARGTTSLVWRTTVGNVGTLVVKECILVDAHSGKVAFSYPLIHDAKYRMIYNLAAGGALVREEGDPPTGTMDVDLAYDYLGDTYDFYAAEHARDSIDDAGMTMIADVHLNDANAYWDGSRMIFGTGWAVDDVVAHEMTHGVTQYESNLIYWYESGAINESFSDMWGEWVDFGNGSGDDSPAVRWLVREDFPLGANRDMANPPAFGHPDRMGSPYWYTGDLDEGGVHTNSGVGNKLCYLLTDGDTFNGHTVSGMGVSAAADLFYECQTNLLTAGSDYGDLYNAATQAAINLGWSQAERDNLEEACLAVEIKPLPERISNLRATSSDGDPNVYLTWTNPTEVGLASIEIRRKTGAFPTSPTDGDSVYNGLGTSMTDGPLSIGTEYFYSAWAFYGGTDYSHPAHARVVAGEDAPEYFTELFAAGDNDLDNLTITFTPDGSADFYRATVESATAFPTHPSGGNLLFLGDDDYAAVGLSGAQVSLYGTAYSSFYVGSNGYITFNQGDIEYSESLAQHFAIPRISALCDDLNPSTGGTVGWQQLGDKAVVTFQGTPEYGTANSNNFQVEMFFDGTIQITWLAIAATDGLAGLSQGGGTPGDFVGSDLSAYPAGGDEDTDDDGLLDSVETNTGVYVDETDTGTDPNDPDSDDDGLPDGWEVANNLDPNDGSGDNGAAGDPDGDGLTNSEEYALGANPNSRDSDDDGLSDGDEVSTYGTNPNDPDSDDDGLPDGWEVDNGLEPDDNTGNNGTDGDPDGDGISNLEEYEQGYDPQLPAPVAPFDSSETSGNRPLTVDFTNESTGSITSWEWDFGDGYTSSAQNPSHTYYFIRDYTVTLTVTGPGGADIETEIIHVDQALPAEGRSYKTIINDVKVTYSKPTCFACYNHLQDSLLIAVWGDELGALNVKAGPYAFFEWDDRCDVVIDAPDTYFKKINLKGIQDLLDLYVCGQVGYVKNFILKDGYVGGTLHYGEEFGLGSAAQDPPNKIMIQRGAATAPVLGIGYPELRSIPTSVEEVLANLEMDMKLKAKPFYVVLEDEIDEDDVDDEDDKADELEFEEIEASVETKAGYVTEVFDITVRYSKQGCVAYRNGDDGTLTIDITEGGGNLLVKCGGTAFLDWGDYCDLYIYAPDVSINTMNLKGNLDTRLHVVGSVGYVNNFKLKYGCVGDADSYGRDFGLGSTLLTPPNKILIKWGWTTAPLLGVSY